MSGSIPRVAGKGSAPHGTLRLSARAGALSGHAGGRRLAARDPGGGHPLPPAPPPAAGGLSQRDEPRGRADAPEMSLPPRALGPPPPPGPPAPRAPPPFPQ